MRIVEVEVIPLIRGTVDGGWPDGHVPDDNLHSILRVATETGLTGWGSVFTTGKLTTAAMETLWPMLRGQSACEPERVTEILRQKNFWLGRGGAVEHAISGVDLALWDLWGKICQQPVSRLMGGCYRERVPAYASVLFCEPEQLAGRLIPVVERGYRAIKMGWRPFGRVSRSYDEELIRAARAAVGPDIQLIVDAGGSEEFWPHKVSWAKATAEMLADYGVLWFEEALAPDDIDGYVELTRSSPIPISTGEVLTRRQAFQPWIDRRAVHILQPDCTKNGGLSESRRIAWAALDHGLEVIPHGWNTAVGLTADLHFAAAMTHCRYIEALTPCPYIDDLLVKPPKLDAAGCLAVPTGPGLGIELDLEKLDWMAGDRTLFRILD